MTDVPVLRPQRHATRQDVLAAFPPDKASNFDPPSPDPPGPWQDAPAVQVFGFEEGRLIEKAPPPAPTLELQVSTKLQGGQVNVEMACVRCGAYLIGVMPLPKPPRVTDPTVPTVHVDLDIEKLVTAEYGLCPCCQEQGLLVTGEVAFDFRVKEATV